MVDCAEPPYNISGLFIYWPCVGVRCNRVLARPSPPLIVITYFHCLRANVLREDVVVTAAAGIRASLLQLFQQRLNSEWFNTSGTGPNTWSLFVDMWEINTGLNTISHSYHTSHLEIYVMASLLQGQHSFRSSSAYIRQMPRQVFL